MNHWHSRHPRRRFLASTLGGTIAAAFAARGRVASAAESRPKAERCVLVWLAGGPSHIDTFDPKLDSETKGPLAAIDTKIAGVKFAEPLPKLAQRADKLCVVRSLTSKEEDHDRAYTLLHTGHAPQPTLEYPALGSAVARERGGASDLPDFVAMGDTTPGSGFFGASHAPYVMDSLGETPATLRPNENVPEARQARRFAALEGFNSGFVQNPPGRVAAAEVARRARRMVVSPQVQAFDLKAEPAEGRALYGLGEEIDDSVRFAASCLQARRLLEQGVRFVEIGLGDWDTHENNFDAVKENCGPLDAGLAALLDDLSNRGMLDSTLVVCVGEFGRTPTINEGNGRDHWADAFSAVLAGGGVRGGQVIGKTDEKGAEVADRPVTIPQFYATLLAALGLDPHKQYTAPNGRPIRLVDEAEPVAEIFG